MDYSEKIDELISDRTKFDEVVYTPINDAMAQIKERWGNKLLEDKISQYLNNNIPEQLRPGFKFVIFRHLCTPNYELHRFVSAVDAFGWQPVFGEYVEDKFTPNNPIKYYLGRLGFHFGYGRKGGAKIQSVNILDFNTSNGKHLSTLKTSWGQSLKDFHRELLQKRYPQFSEPSTFFDSSDWFKANGNSAKEYYVKFLALFIRHGILFENFLLTDEELVFTREYFLPAFFKVWEEIGEKPLIVALSPTSIEGDEFWMCYPSFMLEHLNGKLPNSL